MISPELLPAFLAATIVFALVPGPASLYAAARTLAGGRSAGLRAAFGIHLGGYAHVAVAAAGLSVTFHGAPLLFTAMQLLGAAYLVWLGLALIRARNRAPDGSGGAETGRRPLRESVALEVLNPATALFFLAFLPQFVASGSGVPVWLQLLVLGVSVNLILSAGEVLVVVLAGMVASRLGGSGRGLVIVQRLGGSILVGLALHLAVGASLA